MEFVEVIDDSRGPIVKIGECFYSLNGSYFDFLGEFLKKEIKIKKKIKDIKILDGSKINDDNERYKVFVLIDGDLVVAKMIVFYNTIENYAIEDKSIYVMAFAVLESKQHMGYGKKSLLFVEKEHKGFDVLLGVEENNKIAYSLYNKLGYKLKQKNVFNEDFDFIFDLLIKEGV